MELNISDYYRDLFKSFHNSKKKIEEQITKDFPRLHFYWNRIRVPTKQHFYGILKALPFKNSKKRLLWILPSQVSLFIFYQYLHTTHYPNGYIVSEVSDDDRVKNHFEIYVNSSTDGKVSVHIHKNFRVVSRETLEHVRYISLSIYFRLANSEYLDISLNELKV